MKNFLFIIVFLSFNVYPDEFSSRAQALTQKLKSSLQTELQKAIKEKGVVGAIDFCHLQVKPIAKNAAGEDLTSLSFGRTSHQIRNAHNKPLDWHLKYLKHFQETGSKEAVSGVLADGTPFYIEPLYTQAQCLSCHGQNISAPVKKKISELYPDDKATGFKLNDFRGMIWVTKKKSE